MKPRGRPCAAPSSQFFTFQLKLHDGTICSSPTFGAVIRSRRTAEHTTPEAADVRLRKLDALVEGNPSKPPSSFVRELFPELDVLDAVSELRDQFHSKKVVCKTRFPGRRSGTDAKAFTLEQYGDEIRSGALGPGRLETIDQNLYMSLRQRLESETPARSVAEFFAEHAAEEKQGSPLARRINACASILDTTPTDAGRFFAGVRPDRVR